MKTRALVVLALLAVTAHADAPSREVRALQDRVSALEGTVEHLTKKLKRLESDVETLQSR